jgi:hypothetical protein
MIEMEESFGLSLLANGQIRLHMKDDSVYCHLDDTSFGEKYSKDFRLVFEESWYLCRLRYYGVSKKPTNLPYYA